MRDQVSGHTDQDMPTRIRIAPLPELLHAGLKQLIGMKARVFPQQPAAKGRDEGVWGISTLQEAGHDPG